MKKKFITLKDYRAHLPTVWKDAHAHNVIYVVTVHAKPVFELHPVVSSKDLIGAEYELVTEADLKAYKQAQNEYKKGETVDMHTFFQL